MLILNRGQQGIFEFLFNEEGSFYDPTIGATPSDVLISVYRGNFGSGSVVDGPYSFLYQAATPSGNYIEKSINNTVYFGTYGQNPGENIANFDAVKFRFFYTVPDNLFEGSYSVVASTYYQGILIQYVAEFQVVESKFDIVSLYPSGQKSLQKGFRPAFEALEEYRTNSIILLGHADGIAVNDIIRIRTIQQAIDLLKADFKSPLLRGVFDAYAAGARDIFICSAAPMSEYIEDVSQRLVQSPMFARDDATPILMNFYQRYYDRLEETYKIIKEQDYIDIVVPLETSIVQTGNVDFVTQLASYCQDFHNQSGMVQIGIIGSRSLGINDEDVETLKVDTRFTQKYTMFDSNGQIAGDMGRFIIAIYGELIMNHNFLNISYTSSGSATYAGMLSNTAVNQSLIRKKVSSAFSVSGVNLTQKQVDELDAIGINTFTRNTRYRRGNYYEVMVSNDNTMAHPTSNYRKAPQIRLCSMIINEIQAVTRNTVSKFAAQKAVEDVKSILQFLKKNSIITEYDLEAYTDQEIKGKIYFDIKVTSSLGLKKLEFSISSGKGA